MPAYALLLRAVNVGGTGKLPMLALRSMISAGGAQEAKTIGTSGNAVFTAKANPQAVADHVASALSDRFGKPVAVFLRDAASLDAALQANPFQTADPSRVAFLFLDTPIPDDPEAEATHRARETLSPGPGLIYIHYPDGMGRSKLKHPAMAAGTARNLNTVTKLRDAIRALETE